MSWFEDLSHVPAPIKEEDAHEVLMSYLLLFRHGLPLDLEECNGVQLVLFIFLSVKLMKLFFWKVKSLREWSADQSLFLALNRWSKWFKFKYCISFVWIPVAPQIAWTLENPEKHAQMKERARRVGAWKEMKQFEEEALSHEDGLIPWTKVQETVLKMAKTYGHWQNSECQDMKSALVKLQGDGVSGRVRFADFHSSPNTSHYSFTEKEDYLKQVGRNVREWMGPSWYNFKFMRSWDRLHTHTHKSTNSL